MPWMGSPSFTRVFSWTRGSPSTTLVSTQKSLNGKINKSIITSLPLRFVFIIWLTQICEWPIIIEEQGISIFPQKILYHNHKVAHYSKFLATFSNGVLKMSNITKNFLKITKLWLQGHFFYIFMISELLNSPNLHFRKKNL